MKLDVTKFVEGLHNWLGEQFAPVLARLKALESRPSVDHEWVTAEISKKVDPTFLELYELEKEHQRQVEKLKEDHEKAIKAGFDLVVDTVKSQMPPPPENGKDGVDGKPGADGRDGLHLEILPVIDEQRSYPRGTYAKHAGGLWRTFEQTLGMKGWECIVEGIAAIKIEQTTERSYGLSVTRSSGATEVHTAVLPAMIYRGVYRPEKSYEAGDTVTFGGSLWHANDVTEGKPGEPGARGWVLAAKRGADGKDGRNGIDFGKAVQL